MRLIYGDNCHNKCPYCDTYLNVESSWECDPEPYPTQNCKCPKCGKLIVVEQYVVTEFTKHPDNKE